MTIVCTFSFCIVPFQTNFNNYILICLQVRIYNNTFQMQIWNLEIIHSDQYSGPPKTLFLFLNITYQINNYWYNFFFCFLAQL